MHQCPRTRDVLSSRAARDAALRLEQDLSQHVKEMEENYTIFRLLPADITGRLVLCVAVVDMPQLQGLLGHSLAKGKFALLKMLRNTAAHEPNLISIDLIKTALIAVRTSDFAAIFSRIEELAKNSAINILNSVGGKKLSK